MSVKVRTFDIYCFCCIDVATSFFLSLFNSFFRPLYAECSSHQIWICTKYIHYQLENCFRAKQKMQAKLKQQNWKRKWKKCISSAVAAIFVVVICAYVCVCVCLHSVTVLHITINNYEWKNVYTYETWYILSFSLSLVSFRYVPRSSIHTKYMCEDEKKQQQLVNISKQTNDQTRDRFVRTNIRLNENGNDMRVKTRCNENDGKRKRESKKKKLFNWIPLYLFVLFVSIDK